MRPVFVIAKNAFREAIRDKILYGIFGFGALYIFFTLFLARLALSDLVMIKSFGLAGIYVFVTAAAVFLGASLIYREIEQRTLYFVLAKPVGRRDVALGKFLGLWAATALLSVLMTALYVVVVWYKSGGFDGAGAAAALFQLFEAGLFIALLTFLSSFTSPLTATGSTLMILFVGHLLPAVLESARLIGGVTRVIVTAFYYVWPNFEKFNMRNAAAHGVLPNGPSLFFAAAYMALYAGLFLWAACRILERRDL